MITRANLAKACPDREDLSDLVDGAVPWIRRRQLGLHVAKCARCAQRLAEEEGLRDGARAFGGAALAPARLRPTVLAAVAKAGQSAPSRRAHRQRRWTATAAALAACGIAASVVAVLRPGEQALPAYAEVQAAMRSVQTARWTEEMDFYHVKTGRVEHITTHWYARMDPPAVSRFSSNGFASTMSPANVSAQRAGRSIVYTGPPGSGYFSIRGGSKPNAASAIRQQILFDLMPAEFWAELRRTPACTVDWIGGRQTLRYTMGMGSARSDILRFEDRLTKPGFRRVLWTDRDSHRVVRSLSEYYDGQKHWRTVGYDYDYDRPLPNSLFAPQPYPPVPARIKR